jgi:DNA-binding response OmpR family regulator
MIPTQPWRILVVDDAPEIRDLIEFYLSGEGFSVDTADGGLALREVMSRQPADLVILDLGLPGEDGLSLTRFLREHYDVGIIIVTGKGDVFDRVIGLEVGADDYLSKPFELRELLARVRSVLRRTRTNSVAPPPHDEPRRNAVDGPDRHERQDLIRFAGWRLDVRRRQLFAPDGREVELSTGEFTLLNIFLQHPDHILTRDTLIDLIHNRKAGPFDRSIDVQVGRLRRKIETEPDKPVLIKSVRGVGYVFTPDVERN